MSGTPRPASFPPDRQWSLYWTRARQGRESPSKPLHKQIGIPEIRILSINTGDGAHPSRLWRREPWQLHLEVDLHVEGRQRLWNLLAALQKMRHELQRFLSRWNRRFPSTDDRWRSSPGEKLGTCGLKPAQTPFALGTRNQVWAAVRPTCAARASSVFTSRKCVQRAPAHLPTGSAQDAAPRPGLVGTHFLPIGPWDLTSLPGSVFLRR